MSGTQKKTECVLICAELSINDYTLMCTYNCFKFTFVSYMIQVTKKKKKVIPVDMVSERLTFFTRNFRFHLILKKTTARLVQPTEIWPISLSIFAFKHFFDRSERVVVVSTILFDKLYSGFVVIILDSGFTKMCFISPFWQTLLWLGKCSNISTRYLKCRVIVLPAVLCGLKH